MPILNTTELFTYGIILDVHFTCIIVKYYSYMPEVTDQIRKPKWLMNFDADVLSKQFDDAFGHRVVILIWNGIDNTSSNPWKKWCVKLHSYVLEKIMNPYILHSVRSK